jgi:hypothetical protein
MQEPAPAAIEEGDSKGPQAAELRVALLVVTERAHELLHRDGFLVGELILLCR